MTRIHGAWRVRQRAIRIQMLAAAFPVALLGCDDTRAAPSAVDPLAPAFGMAGEGAPGVVNVVASGLTLDAPAAIPSGWTTFRFENRSAMTHFFVLERLPAGKTVADSRAAVIPVFQRAMDLIVDGNAPAGFAEFANLPAWYSQVAMVGGPGLLAPGHVGVTTLELEPGTYAIECYVKSPGGTFHSAVGMISGLVVTDDRTSIGEPKADFEVTVANSGLRIAGAPMPGMRTIAVHFAEQRLHENFVGQDVQLVRLSDDTDLAALSAWMDWSTPTGLTTPAPAEFLGGSEEMPAGHTAYVTARLSPGRYAFVSEVTNPLGKGLLVTFNVPAEVTP